MLKSSLERGVVTVRRGFDFLFPNLCAWCCSELEKHEHLFCGPCMASVPAIDPCECPFCLVKNERNACTCAEFTRSHLDGIFSGWVFAGPMREVVHHIKYGGKQRFGRRIGTALGKQIAAALPPAIKGIIPVPVHRARKRERGYNQAEAIARGVADACGIGVDTRILSRRKSSLSQTTRTREKRLQYIRNNFAVNKKMFEYVAGKSFLLVDDVFTTGATVTECGRLLKEAGAAAVYAATVARVLPEEKL